MKGVVYGTIMVTSIGVWTVLFTKIAAKKCVSPQMPTLFF